MPTTCPTCERPLPGAPPGWCAACGRGTRVPARDLLAWLVDDATPVAAVEGSPDPLSWPGYDEVREEARARTGEDEAVVAVRGRVAGGTAEAVFVAWEFGFLGGSIGTVAGERVTRAYEHAGEAGLPVVLLPASGGSRMQEGMASLVQMPKSVLAADEHARRGLLQVAVVRDPTTGGVFASHTNAADVLLAEPGATVGFAGPRVAATLTGGPLPEASHTAEGARAAGLVDAVVPRPELPARLAAVLDWARPDAPREPATPAGRALPPGDAWTQVLRARDPARARTRAHLAGCDEWVELHGDRAGGDDRTVVTALARLAGHRIVVVGLDRHAREGRIGPGGYRKAWRAFALAERLGVAVVTLVDTPGADASASAEAGGVAHHISRTFRELLALSVPTVALVIGEGGSGGALALSTADRLLIQEHAVFSVIAPEGATAILHRDEPDRVAEVAAHLDPTAQRLHALGIADEVVPEPEGEEVAAALAAVARHLDDLGGAPPDERRAARRRRWREPV